MNRKKNFMTTKSILPIKCRYLTSIELTEAPLARENKGSSPPRSGPVAQLGARFHGMEEVVGSIPTRSTNFCDVLEDLHRRRAEFTWLANLAYARPRRRAQRLKSAQRSPLRALLPSAKCCSFSSEACSLRRGNCYFLCKYSPVSHWHVHLP